MQFSVIGIGHGFRSFLFPEHLQQGVGVFKFHHGHMIECFPAIMAFMLNGFRHIIDSTFKFFSDVRSQIFQQLSLDLPQTKFGQYLLRYPLLAHLISVVQKGLLRVTVPILID